MRIKVVYEIQNTGSYFSDNEPVKFKIKVNKAPPQDFTFNKKTALYLENAPVNPVGKKNILYFRIVQPGEKEERKRNLIIINILRGILFVIMVIILPFAFMRFKNNTTPYLRLKFEYSDTDDFVLILNKTTYRWTYESVIAVETQSALIHAQQD